MNAMMELCISTLTQGFIYALLSYGVYITYKILDFPDLTVDGSFPLGAAMPSVKAFEAQEAIAAGAKEIDMVINVGAVKSQEWDLVREDIAAVNKAKGNARLKVIIETCLLTDEEKVKACELSSKAGADFVKTSTGFSKWGAKKEDVSLMRKSIPDTMKVKASGGIRDYESAMEMIAAGAERLGCSSGMAIINGEKSNASY